MAASPSERIELLQGDITKVAADAIVNAANTTLLGGGGVDGAIHRAAGSELLEECRKLGGCPTGSAKITAGYRLPARHVIHAVGPVYRNGNSGEPAQLAGCYRTAFQLALAADCKSIAFPAISCGVYGYPFEAAAQIAVNETVNFLHDHPGFNRVIFVLFDQHAYSVYQQTLKDSLKAPTRSS
jgi:O-acetyl-ADP-ribose deacetylase